MVGYDWTGGFTHRHDLLFWANIFVRGFPLTQLGPLRDVYLGRNCE